MCRGCVVCTGRCGAFVCCSKFAKAEAAVSVNEKKWVVMQVWCIRCKTVLCCRRCIIPEYPVRDSARAMATIWLSYQTNSQTEPFHSLKQTSHCRIPSYNCKQTISMAGQWAGQGTWSATVIDMPHVYPVALQGHAADNASPPPVMAWCNEALLARCTRHDFQKAVQMQGFTVGRCA